MNKYLITLPKSFDSILTEDEKKVLINLLDKLLTNDVIIRIEKIKNQQ